jgi:F-type H+-transporting ATPase subunit b
VNSLAILLQVTAAGAAPRSDEAQLLDLDGTVFVMLGIFLVLLAVLWLLLWRPYLRVRDERVARVEGARNKATRLEAEAASRLSRVESALAEARRAGDAEANKLRLEAQAREQQIIAEAQGAARAMMTEARGKLDAALATEKASLEQQTALLAREIAEKALGRSLAS